MLNARTLQVGDRLRAPGPGNPDLPWEDGEVVWVGEEFLIIRWSFSGERSYSRDEVWPSVLFVGHATVASAYGAIFKPAPPLAALLAFLEHHETLSRIQAAGGIRTQEEHDIAYAAVIYVLTALGGLRNCYIDSSNN